MLGPSPDDPHPMKGFPQVGFLKPLVKNPNIVVGDNLRKWLDNARVVRFLSSNYLEIFNEFQRIVETRQIKPN